MNKIFFIVFLFSVQLFAKEGVFYIRGEAVKAISLSLGVRSIDFGDIFSDTDVEEVPVNFYVNAESGYKYQVEISNNDSTRVLQVSRTSIGEYTTETITYNDIGNGRDQTHEFYVDLDTAKIKNDLSSVITVSITYLDIL